MNLLQNELDWVYYGGKHYESIYTRFYQSYILPKKFEIDKRRGHLSDLIHANQLSRDLALGELQKPVADFQIMNHDKEFVIKKLEMTSNDFQDIMALPHKTFREYPNNFEIIDCIKKILNWLRSKNMYSK